MPTYHRRPRRKPPAFDRYWQSSYDGSWWMTYADDRPSKFYGAFENLPLRVREHYRPRRK